MGPSHESRIGLGYHSVAKDMCDSAGQQLGSYLGG